MCSFLRLQWSPQLPCFHAFWKWFSFLACTPPTCVWVCEPNVDTDVALICTNLFYPRGWDAMRIQSSIVAQSRFLLALRPTTAASQLRTRRYRWSTWCECDPTTPIQSSWSLTRFRVDIQVSPQATKPLMWRIAKSTLGERSTLAKSIASQKSWFCEDVPSSHDD